MKSDVAYNVMREWVARTNKAGDPTWNHGRHPNLDVSTAGKRGLTGNPEARDVPLIISGDQR